MPTRTLVLDGEEAVSQGYPPRNENAQKLGDRLVFSDNITSFQFEPSSPTPVSGSVPPPNVGAQHSGFCIRVRGKGENFWLCQAGFILPGLPNTAYPNGGQIQARGLMNFSGPLPLQAAIDGGFGDYDSAGGRIDVTFPPTPAGAKPKSRWTMTIRTP
jgi:hypothetical protein